MCVEIIHYVYHLTANLFVLSSGADRLVYSWFIGAYN